MEVRLVPSNKDKLPRVKVVHEVKADPTAGMNHIQIFHHLIKAGPTMHGTPGEKKHRSR